MEIKIDKKTGALLVIIALLAGSMLFLLGSRDSDGMSGMHDHMGPTSMNSNYTGADIMFLQMMIPHHQQAIDMSNLALKISSNEELRSLATKIATDQAAEIVQMQNWLNKAGASEDPGHSMSGMGGMLTADEYSKLQAASGKEFDKIGRAHV